VNADIQSRVDLLSDVIVDAIDAVDNALEEKTRDLLLAANAKVVATVTVYQELLAVIPPEERAAFEKRFERRVTDLRRQAARLPAGATGTYVATAIDAGVVPFILQRTPGKSIQNIEGPSSRAERPKYTTGGEVDAWCGPCSGMRTHNIYALVEGLPTIVICQACGARHNFRTTPGRKKASLEEAPARPVAMTRTLTREQQEEAKRAQDKVVLKAELAAATKVRPFSPRERYKAGEVIEHPEHGRGKIESVMRRSMLVRFGIGLRPVDLQ
jgi:hypothetical protein